MVLRLCLHHSPAPKPAALGRDARSDSEKSCSNDSGGQEVFGLDESGKDDTFQKNFWSSQASRLTRLSTSSRRSRHDSKNIARRLARTAMGDPNFIAEPKGSGSRWRHFVSHCVATDLTIAHELGRAFPQEGHPLVKLVRRCEHDGLAILAPHLNAADYGSVFVRRTEHGIYIGQGIKRRCRGHEILQAEGQGFFLFQDGRQVSGPWHNNQPSGDMTYYPGVGRVRCYHAPMLDYRVHGDGTAICHDGRRLTGRWQQGRRQGQGTEISSDGATLQGVWRDDELLSGAKYTSADGRHYRGEFDYSAGKPSGRGMIFWSAGTERGACFEGFVECGEPQGIGTYRFGPSHRLYGYVYDGPWMDGKKHGAGVLIKMVSRQRYMCDFTEDRLNHFC